MPLAEVITEAGHAAGRLGAFRGYYNTDRPHRSPVGRTPAQADTARPKAIATSRPLIDGHSASATTRHDRFQRRIHPRPDSRLHHIGLGRRHAGTPSCSSSTTCTCE